MNKPIIFAYHNSSAESTKSLIENSDLEADVYTFGPANEVFEKAGIIHDSLEDLLITGSQVNKDSMKSIINGKNPSIVVVGTSVPGGEISITPEQAATEAANELGIPSLSIIDYWGNPGIRYRDLSGTFHFPRKIAALDIFSKDIMIKERFNSDMIEVTGNPQHDRLVELAKEWNANLNISIRRDLGLRDQDFEKYFINFIGSVKEDMDRDKTGFWDLDCVKAMSKGIAYLPKERRKEIVLRLNKHPRETKETYNRVFEVARDILPDLNIVYASGGYSGDPDLMPLAADLTISPRSNILVAGTLMDQDCISIQPGIQGEDPFVTNILNLTPHAYSIDQTEYIVCAAIENPKEFFDSFREKRKGFKVDGKASRRVRDLMKREIQNS